MKGKKFLGRPERGKHPVGYMGILGAIFAKTEMGNIHVTYRPIRGGFLDTRDARMEVLKFSWVVGNAGNVRWRYGQFRQFFSKIKLGNLHL